MDNHKGYWRAVVGKGVELEGVDTVEFRRWRLSGYGALLWRMAGA